jgi:glyoxylase-like metal-dependent hydrolase (beta-lactamase superfamily II)
MTRRRVLAVLVAVGTISIAASAYRQQDAPRSVQVEKVRDNLFVLRGGGGNTAVFVQSGGVTVVDTKLPGWGQPILDAVKGLTSKPVTTIINTHTHGDHVSGNVEFPAAVDIVTHENTAANMRKMAPVTGFAAPAGRQPSIFESSGGRGLPTRTFGERMALGSGDDAVALYYFGRGHTNGDAVVVFPALRVMHMGDLFPGKRLPIMDANNGGSGVAYPDTLRKAAGIANVDTVIPGHSALMTSGDLLEYATFIGEFVDYVRAGAKAGRTLDQIVEGWTLPAKYPAYEKDPGPWLRTDAQVILDELR